jgi:hypothetical protein
MMLNLLPLHFHRSFLQSELKQFLPDGSFVSLTWRRLGKSVSLIWQGFGGNLRYRIVDGPGKRETKYSRFFPVDVLFLWATKDDGGLDPKWLRAKDGSYIDDFGKEIPPTVKPAFSVSEQLAAYGQWLLSEEFDDVNEPKGFHRSEVVEHSIERLLLAYQALAYAYRALHGITDLTPEEKKKTALIDFSTFGKVGARKRHAPMVKLRTWAIEKYRAGKWASANQAAHALKGEALQHGRIIGARLSEENAQRTLAEWFRKSV